MANRIVAHIVVRHKCFIHRERHYIVSDTHEEMLMIRNKQYQKSIHVLIKIERVRSKRQRENSIEEKTYLHFRSKSLRRRTVTQLAVIRGEDSRGQLRVVHRRP